MNDKYSDLPDIEEGPSVFETSDIDSDVEPIVSSIVEETSDVDVNEMNHQQSRDKFSHQILDGDIKNCDFSGNLEAKFNESGYHVSQVNETMEQKIVRISRELEEIKFIQNQENSKGVEREKIDNLVGILENVKLQKEGVDNNNHINDQYNKRIKGVFEITSKILNEKQNNTNTQSSNKQSTDSHNNTTLLEIESKINQLENYLGVSFKEIESGLSIQEQINDLQRKVNLIYNPEYHLNHVKQELDQLNNKMESYYKNRRLSQLSSNKSMVPPLENEQILTNEKIEQLYTKLPEFEKVANILPHLLVRLKSLNHVHNDLGGCVGSIGQLDHVLRDLKLDMMKWDTNLTQINEQLDANGKIFEDNKKDIEEWLDDLEKRVGK
ncbi:nuclear migration protein Jnm1p [[Candida] anglica]|uniref:Nuclear migration protein Jnm1p n=1 Tax=[Candida] anglica TaxID=148631 RepID=A0ABP0ELK5_9ASCO